MTLPSLVNVAQRFLGAAASSSGGTNAEWYIKIVQPILKLLDDLLVPLLIVLGSAGMIYAIVLGVNFAKAETSDKREEAKKRMINFIIGFVVTIVLLIVLKLIVNNVTSIKGAIDNVTSSAAAT